jgi:hypothetical protein
MSSRRKSLGGPSRVVLRDSSSRYNQGEEEDDFAETPPKPRLGLLDKTGYRSSSAARRQTLGGNSLKSETPAKDRRAMLAAWRQSRNEGPEEVDTRKRTRNDPPLPPSGYANGDQLSSSRKQQRFEENTSVEKPLSQNTYPGTSIHYDDDESEGYYSARSAKTAYTPLGRSSRLGSARRKTFMGGRSLLPRAEGMYSIRA